ncbi:MAG: triose-phosphate isomerase [Bacilli bacterium]|nr:triose-phosphate isomerase [Bacilli bacterium]
MILVLNLKMNLTKTSILEYENFIHDKKVIVLPQYPYLLLFKKGSYALGSQDVSKFAKGSFTGEVCAKGLKGLGVKYVLIGHSERKEHFGETLSDFKAKIKNTIDNEMIPIYCINQTREEKNNDPELKLIEDQLEAIPENVKYIIIAFEPTWLIGGSEEVIDVAHIERVIVKIKDYLVERNINHSIIYGGGINPENIDIIKNIQGNEGFIISSSALERDKLEIIYDKIK